MTGIQNMNEDPNVQLRVDVAEMKGMLSQALSDHSSRINNTEQALNVERERVTKADQLIGQHTVEISNLKADIISNIAEISTIKAALSNQLSKTVQVGGGLLAAAALVLTLIDKLNGGA